MKTDLIFTVLIGLFISISIYHSTAIPETQGLGTVPGQETAPAFALLALFTFLIYILHFIFRK